jgi:hypothetical protein
MEIRLPIDLLQGGLESHIAQIERNDALERRHRNLARSGQSWRCVLGPLLCDGKRGRSSGNSLRREWRTKPQGAPDNTDADQWMMGVHAISSCEEPTWRDDDEAGTMKR